MRHEFGEPTLPFSDYLTCKSNGKKLTTLTAEEQEKRVNMIADTFREHTEEFLALKEKTTLMPEYLCHIEIEVRREAFVNTAVLSIQAWWRMTRRRKFRHLRRGTMIVNHQVFYGSGIALLQRKFRQMYKKIQARKKFERSCIKIQAVFRGKLFLRATI